MRIISYIAMIATAAFCQLSSCMNQLPHPTNSNQSPPPVRTIDTWTVKVPIDFSVKFIQTNNLVGEVDFDTKEARIPCMPSISVSCTGQEGAGRTSLSIDHSRFPSIMFQASNPHAPFTPSVDMCPLHFSWDFVQTENRVVEVDFSTKKARVPLRKNIQLSVAGSEWNTSLSIVHKYLPTSTIPAGAPHEFSRPLMETRPTIETKESKPLKQPDSLKEIEDLNSHIKKSPKKEAKKIEQFERKTFLDKYSKQCLDVGVKESIKVLFNSGIKAPAKILDELLTPTDNKRREKEFRQVLRKVCQYVQNL